MNLFLNLFLKSVYEFNIRSTLLKHIYVTGTISCRQIADCRVKPSPELNIE